MTEPCMPCVYLYMRKQSALARSWLGGKKIKGGENDLDVSTLSVVRSTWME